MSSYASSASWPPRRMLIACLIGVALSTDLLPFVRGCGTQLYLCIVLFSWYVSAEYANGSILVYYLGRIAINVFLFLFPALPLYFILRRHAPIFVSRTLAAWLLFYLGCLFILFPATDCP